MKKVFAIFAIAALTACGGPETPAENASPAAETNSPAADTNSPAADTNSPAADTKSPAAEAKDAKKADAPKEEKKAKS